MVVKKSILCKQCNSYIDYYIEERHHLNKTSLKCKCGHHQKCSFNKSKKNKIRK